MTRPDIEGIENRLKRGTGYRRMQGTALTLISWIKELEAKHICGRAGFVFGEDVCPACVKRDNHKWKK